MEEQITETKEAQSASSKSKTPKLAFLVLGGVLLVILVFVLGFYIGSSRPRLPSKPQELPVSVPGEGIEWNTYEGTEYKFKYPKGWHVYIGAWPYVSYDAQEEIDTSVIVIDNRPIDTPYNIGAMGVFIKDQYRNPNSAKPDLNLEEFLNEEKKSWKNLKETNFESDGIKFVRLDGERSFGEMGYEKIVTYYFSYDEPIANSDEIIKHIGTAEIFDCQDLTNQECRVKDEIVKSLRVVFD